MKRTFFSLVALLTATLPAFCGVVIGAPEPKSSSWIYGVALAGVAGFVAFKNKKK